MRLKRFENWPELLYGYVESVKDKPFQYGTHDCALFTCNAINIMTGVDLAQPFRGKYKTSRGAYGALKRFSGGGLLETSMKIFGKYNCEVIPHTMAQRGDAILSGIGGETVLGLIGLDGKAIFSGENGVVANQEAEPIIAWRVG